MRVGLRIRDLNAYRCLRHTEAVGVVAREIEPGQGRDVEAFFRAAMVAVPACSYSRGDRLGEGSLTERHPVKGGVIPLCKGPLVIRAVATHIAKGEVSRKHEQESQHMGNKLVLRFLGLRETTQYTLEQSHGVPPISVALDNTTLREEGSCGYSSVKTVRSIGTENSVERSNTREAS
jgi:hypothetical protein